ncbi:hypothetical protein FOL47_005523 [Perkinsus chesapeaki]|uniref:Cationic amino acid transporter C-terminal domain-containing protein n=1 Tax=Perkinsus chesapeaki TaxID=330153 RepID=A0A7J6LX70_PERCH|nr:hypothetical protein FOL47_005523 [Perkinsus chesapeaki]
MACINCIVLVTISIYGVIRYGDSSNFGSPWLSNPDDNDDAIDGIGGVLRGSGLAFFCCVGWDAVCTLSEEVKDSKKDIPRGIMGTLVIVALLYVGLSISFSLIVPVDSIDIKAPLAGAFQYHNDFYGYIAVSLAATTVCIPSVMAGIVSQPRIWYRMALDGLLYDNFAKLNVNDIPVVGTVVCGIMATILSGLLRFDYLAGMVSLSITSHNVKDSKGGILYKMGRRQPLSVVLASEGSNNDGDNSGAGLKKCLGLPEVISFGISTTVGSGIFVTVGIIAVKFSGPALFISFLVAIAGSLLSAFCYAEFAAKIPVAGQAYTYSYVCIGELAGFINGWLSTIPYCIASAAVARGWANYVQCFIQAAFNVSLPLWMYATPTQYGIISYSFLAPALCAICTLICLSGVKESATFSFGMACLNVFLLLVFSIYGSYMYGDVGNMEPFTLPNDEAADGIGGFAGVLRGSGLAFFCCVGWDAVCTLSEEVRNPKRDIPWGIMGTPSVMSGIVGQPRIWYRMALDGLLFKPFAKLSSQDVPVIGTTICGIIATLLSAVCDFEPLAGMTSFSTLAMFTLVNAGIILTRAEEYFTRSMSAAAVASDDNHFRCPWVPVLPAVAVWVNCYLMASLGIQALVMVTVWLVLGLGVYLTYSAKHSKLN